MLCTLPQPWPVTALSSARRKVYQSVLDGLPPVGGAQDDEGQSRDLVATGFRAAPAADLAGADMPRHALIEVYLARRNDLRGVASRIVGHSDQVDDVLQDAYLKLVDGVCAREVLNPFGYCCQVVRNMALDYCRRRMVESACFVSNPDGELPEVEGGRAAEAGIDERRILERIETALATLPPRTRHVFELYRLEGRTQRDIAQSLGVSATLVNFMIKDVMMVLAGCSDVFGD